ncbi:MAG: hypothetical protein IJX04_00440 [Oscillospiraceae bacterium]|nr:hypothetical protein [Oscillospiraceae bacterium]
MIPKRNCLLRNGHNRSLQRNYKVMHMTYNCCFCGKPIEERPYTLTVTKENCETSQELYCHEVCLEQALREPKDLYLKVL